MWSAASSPLNGALQFRESFPRHCSKYFHRLNVLRCLGPHTTSSPPRRLLGFWLEKWTFFCVAVETAYKVKSAVKLQYPSALKRKVWSVCIWIHYLLGRIAEESILVSCSFDIALWEIHHRHQHCFPSFCVFPSRTVPLHACTRALFRHGNCPNRRSSSFLPSFLPSFGWALRVSVCGSLWNYPDLYEPPPPSPPPYPQGCRQVLAQRLLYSSYLLSA